MHSNPKTLKSHLKCTNVTALDANQLISIWKKISQMYIWSNLMTIIHCLVWFECLNTEIWGSLHINQVLKLKKKTKTEFYSELWELYITLWHKTTQKSSNCFLYLCFTLPLLLFLTATGGQLAFPPLGSLLGFTGQILCEGKQHTMALLHTHKQSWNSVNLNIWTPLE